jgi:hypothetical protein
VSETEVRVPIADLAAPRVLRWADPGRAPALVHVHMVWRRKPGRAELFLDGSPRFVRTVRDGGEVVAVDRDVDRCAYCGLYALVPWHSSCRSCERPNDRAQKAEAPLPADPIATRFIEAYHDAAMGLCDVADDAAKSPGDFLRNLRVQAASFERNGWVTLGTFAPKADLGLVKLNAAADGPAPTERERKGEAAVDDRPGTSDYTHGQPEAERRQREAIRAELDRPAAGKGRVR